MGMTWLPASLCKWAITPLRMPMLTLAPSAPKAIHLFIHSFPGQSTASKAALVAFKTPGKKQLNKTQNSLNKKCYHIYRFTMVH